MDLSPVTLDEQIAEVRRELELRKRVYPAWVERGKMTQEAADTHMRRMEVALETLETLNRMRKAQKPFTSDNGR